MIKIMKKYNTLIILIIFLLIKINKIESNNNDNDNNNNNRLSKLDNTCINSIDSPDWWSYELCFKRHVKQLHYDSQLRKITTINHIGNWIEYESGLTHHIFRSNIADCILDDGSKINRYAEVTFNCCKEWASDKKETYLQSVIEPKSCTYYIDVCSTYVCDNNLSLIHI